MILSVVEIDYQLNTPTCSKNSDKCAPYLFVPLCFFFFINSKINSIHNRPNVLSFVLLLYS